MASRLKFRLLKWASRLKPRLYDKSGSHQSNIKIIRAAPFSRLIREGIEVYQLHISPVSPHKTLHMEQTQNSEKKKTEQEILDKVVPPEYHDFTNVFSEGEAKTLPPHWPYWYGLNQFNHIKFDFCDFSIIHLCGHYLQLQWYRESLNTPCSVD